jgi:DNA-binding MarR family transcriptional regulator
MAHTVRVMPESDEAKAIRKAEQMHDEVLEEAITWVIATLPQMFRKVKHQTRGGEVHHQDHELGEQQWWVLYRLAKGKQLSSELSRMLNVTTPTITQLVDSLVKKGYVERQPDAEDRRKIYLRLTPKGQEAGDFAHARFREAMHNFLSPLNYGQLHDVATACRHISTLLPKGLYDYEGACPARPEAAEVSASGAGRNNIPSD